MTKEEAVKLLDWALAAFPHMQDKEMGPTAKVWQTMLEDIPYQLGQKALKKVLSTAKFFPTIGEIREAVNYIANANQMTGMEAWGVLMDNIRQYGSYRSVEGIQALPETIQKVVHSFGYTNICRSENIDVIRGQFIKAWEIQNKRDKELAILPADVRELITGAVKQLPQ